MLFELLLAFLPRLKKLLLDFLPRSLALDDLASSRDAELCLDAGLASSSSSLLLVFGGRPLFGPLSLGSLPMGSADLDRVFTLKKLLNPPFFSWAVGDSSSEGEEEEEVSSSFFFDASRGNSARGGEADRDLDVGSDGDEGEGGRRSATAARAGETASTSALTVMGFWMTGCLAGTCTCCLSSSSIRWDTSTGPGPPPPGRGSEDDDDVEGGFCFRRSLALLKNPPNTGDLSALFPGGARSGEGADDVEDEDEDLLLLLDLLALSGLSSFLRLTTMSSTLLL